MADYDPFDSDSDPFKPPAISTLVSCLHCSQEYDSFRIEWRIERNNKGEAHGFWCCPIAGCDGKGFGFDIFPVDPEYQDERGCSHRDPPPSAWGAQGAEHITPPG